MPSARMPYRDARVRNLMEPVGLINRHITERFDVAVIGAGPAGLSAGISLLDTARTFVVLEVGLEVEKRRRDRPGPVIRGIGGAGLYSDGKFSFYPSASGLWRLRNESRLKESYDWFIAVAERYGLSSPPFPVRTLTQNESNADGFKTYPSLYMSLDDRKAMVQSLSSLLGPSLRTASRVVGIRETNEGFLLHVETRSGFQAIFSSTVVFAGGRFGPIELARMMPEAPMIFRRFEVGIRLEQPAGGFLFQTHPSTDVKQIIHNRDVDSEWRTFCTCRNGEVVPTRWDDIRSFSGRADDEDTGLSNIGINLRFNNRGSLGELYAELHDLVYGHVDTFQVSLREYLDPGGDFLGPRLDQKFRQRLKELLVGSNIESSSVHGPCIEGVGYYPDINDSLKLNSHDVWVAGDAAGLFRGLVPSMVSGYYCGRQVADYLTGTKTVPGFVKESSVTPMPVVFTAQSKAFFYCRDAICEYVLRRGMLPINPFRVFEYFLGDRVERQLVRQGNNQLVALADEVWVFGPVSDGVLFEIVRARKLHKPVRLFSIGTRAVDIKPLSIGDVKFEPEVHAAQIRRDDLISLLADALPLSDAMTSPQLRLLFDEPTKS